MSKTESGISCGGETYHTFGAVVFVVNKNGEFLWTNSENDQGRPDKRGLQVICETSKHGENSWVTARRGIEEELTGNDPNLLGKITFPRWYCSVLFSEGVEASVFVSVWRGEPDFTDFPCPDGEVGKPQWLTVDQPLPGHSRKGVFNVLSQLDFKRFIEFVRSIQSQHATLNE